MGFSFSIARSVQKSKESEIFFSLRRVRGAGFFCCSEMKTRKVMMKCAWCCREGVLLSQSNDENERNSEWMNGMAECCGDGWVDARIPEHVTFFSLF